MAVNETFEREISLIKNIDYQNFICYYLDSVGDWFFHEAASSTGRYHPQFAKGEGGLVRHTKAVVMFAEELLRMSPYCYYPEEYKDYIIMACIVHDTCKYGLGEYDKTQYKYHARNAAICVNNKWLEYFNEPAPFLLLSAIRGHMGQWSEKEDKPFTSIDHCVHLADYMASRNFIDIPILNSNNESEKK